MDRRSLRTITTALVAALALAVAACGSDSGSEDGGPSGSSSATTTAATGPFPVEVEHKFGTTTVPEQPERIAVIGLTEQDIVLELGFKPIATTEWYGEQPHAVWPWAQELLGDAEPEVLSVADGFQFERIAKLAPDLIIGTNAGVERKDYDKLSQIAPTIPGVKGSTPYFSKWEDQTEVIAKALGKEQEGKDLVADVKAAYAEVAAQHPEFEGKVATFAQNGFYSGLLYVYPPGLGTDFLSHLGFTINPELEGKAKPGEQVTISPERLDVIDTDVVVFATEKPSDITKLEKVPTFLQMDAVKDHRAVFTDATLSGAMYFVTPLSLRYVLEHLTPQLADAVAGKAPRRMRSPDGS